MQVGVVDHFVILIQRKERMEILRHGTDMALLIVFVTPFRKRQLGYLRQNRQWVHFAKAVFEITVAAEAPAGVAGRPTYLLVAPGGSTAEEHPAFAPEAH